MRLDLPFSLKCARCGVFVKRGRRFNARKQKTDEKYLSITILRFYIRCPECSSEIAFKTDPQANDYQCGIGARRVYSTSDVQKDDNSSHTRDTKSALDEDGDALAAIQSRADSSKAATAVADGLDAIRSRNAKREQAQSKALTDTLGTENLHAIADQDTAEQVFRAAKQAHEAALLKNSEPRNNTHSFARGGKRKRDFKAELGIKKKAPRGG